jgi:RimJ/RimL family protein N-acetyltransferase
LNQSPVPYMLTEVASPNTLAIRELFGSHKRGRAVIKAVLELGNGRVLVDDIEVPRVGSLIFFPLVFLGGDNRAAAATEYVKSIPAKHLIVPPDDKWDRLVRRTLGSKLLVQKRTRLSERSLNLKHVRALKQKLPDDYTLQSIDRSAVESLDHELRGPIDFFYGSIDAFMEDQVGFCIKHNDEVASVAYPAFPYVKEFEIQVATVDRPEFRRKGLATAACAALIEYSLENGLVPHWDAANEASVNLALKLGYTDPDVWHVYFWRD